MKKIWTEDEAEFHGAYVDFDPLWSWPKPAGHVPVLVGGDGPGTFERVLDYGDGWMPMNRGTTERLVARIEELRALTERAGRKPVPVTLFGATPEAAAIRRYEDLGIHRLLFALPSVALPEAVVLLDRMANAADGHLLSDQ